MAPRAGCTPPRRAPGVCGAQARSCLPRLSDGSCLFLLPICLTPLGAACLWGLIYGNPCSRGAAPGSLGKELGSSGRWGGDSAVIAAGLGFGRFSFSICTWDEGCADGEAAARRSRAGEAFPSAVGVSRPWFDCENNSRAGQCSCILLLPYSPCLLSFVWVSSCSDLPLSASLDAALRSQRFCLRRSLPERLIKRREDVFQKYLAFWSDI